MEHVIPFKDVQVPDILLGRILAKTQTEAEVVTCPGTVSFSLRILVFSCHPDCSFFFNRKYNY